MIRNIKKDHLSTNNSRVLLKRVDNINQDLTVRLLQLYNQLPKPF